MAHRRSTQSAPSCVSEREPDESELAKLERQFRIMDRDGRAYNRQAREQIHKQQQDIDKLLKEQEELHRNLGICKNFSRVHSDNKDTKSLRDLLEQEDTINAALIKEKERQQELEKQIADMHMKIANTRKEKVRGNETQTSQKEQSQKALHTLEYKLDRALTHFSEQMTKNSQLRKELQTLHVEQMRFQKLQNRLKKELYELRKKILGSVNRSIAAFSDRAEAQSKMVLLKEKALKDLSQYNTEIKDLERQIAHECDLKEFMTTKCSGRSVRDQGSKMKEQRIDSGEESRDALEEVFSKIQTVTGEDNLDLLVTRFIQIEDQKFALFNFVNDQNNEADILKEQISQIRAEIQHFQAKRVQKEKDNGSFLADIEGKIAKLRSQAEDYEKQACVIDELLGNVKTVITRIFSEMEWDGSTKEDTLGSSVGLSENNIMSYLGLTEDKITELLGIQAFLNSKDADRNNPKDLAKFFLSPNSERLQQQISFQPAVNTADYEPDEAALTDEEEWPISQEELRKKISKQVGEIIQMVKDFTCLPGSNAASLFRKAAETCKDPEKLESLYYIMVRERKVCNLAAQEQLNKQEQVIKKLLKDQQEVKINLNILSAGLKAQQESETKKKLQALAVIVMDKTLKDEKDCETRLDQEISTVTAETMKFKKQKSVVTQCAERNQTQNSLCFLENDLSRSLNYLDAQENGIREIKKELKNQRDENVRLELNQTTYPHKKVMNDLSLYIRANMKCTTFACENRTDVHSKLAMMMKKEQRALAKKQKSINKMAALFPEEVDEAEVKVEENPDDGEEVKPDDGEEVNPDDGEEVNPDDGEEINPEDLEDLTLDALVNKFIQDETQQCALYSLISDQNKEIVDIKEEIRLLHAEVHNSSKKGQSNGKGVNFLAGLRDTCARLQSESEDCENHEELIDNTLRDVTAVLANILSDLGCDLPEEEDVPEDKVVSYLEVMEEKTDKLLNIMAYTKAEVNRLLQGDK